MRHSNTYTLFFAALVCFSCSLALTFVSSSLKSLQEMNVELDMKKNILKVMGFEENLKGLKTHEEIQGFYNKNVKEIVVDKEGVLMTGATPESIKEENGGGLPVYITMENGELTGYTIPIQGKGLWSTLYGYFALEKDANTVKGITFYQHGETPGLGAEIEQPWFQNNFKQKKILDEGDKLRSVSVVKGKVNEVISSEKERIYYVDGISGATMTSRGVTALLKKSLETYHPYITRVRTETEGR